MATIVILLSPRRRGPSLAFLAGWVLTIAVVPLAAASGTLAMPLSRRERVQLVAATEIVLGASLIVGAIVTWRRSRSRQPKAKGRLDALGSYGPRATFGIALLMGLRPKALVLGISAGLALGSQPLSSTGSALALAMYAAISASTVAIPVVGTLVRPDYMEPRLMTWHDWFGRNGQVVSAWVILLVGVWLVAVGLSQA